MAESEITRLRGLQTLAEALRLEDFPMDHTEIDYAVGDIEIEDGRGGYVPVRDLTDQLRDRLFSSPEEVVRSLLLALRKRGTHAA